MTKELLQQCLDALIESRGDVDLCYAGVKAARLSFRQERQLGFYEEQLVKHDAAIEGLKQALAQQEQCGCREGECETKKDKTCRMTIEIAERDGIPEWTPAIGIECAISNLRDDAARLRDGSYTPLQIADDLDVIANDLGKCKSLTQQEQPASVDAYVGAREDAAIWKKRALEAEELNRKFIADVNGPTYLGEPAQPAQKPEAWLIPSLASFKDAKSVSFSRVEGCTLTDAQLIEKMSGEVLCRVEVFSDGDGVIDKHGAHHAPKPLYTHPAPTQPAMSDEQIKSILTQAVQEGKLQWCGFEKDGDGKYTIPALSAHHYQIARAIEAHLAPVQPALSEARWNYINSRAVDMSAAKYEALCSLLHAEVDSTYELGEAVDKAIEAHCRGGANK